MGNLKKVLLITIILSPLVYNSALGWTIGPGFDLFLTRPGDASYEFGGANDCAPIPADFFAPGSDPFVGTVALQGEPLHTSPPGILGPTDTIIERLEEAQFPQCPSSDTIPIEIVALNLVSVEPIVVTYSGGQGPELWDVRMCLSSLSAQQVGRMTINQDCNEGGTFDAQLPVTAKFIFTKVANPSEERISDGAATIDFFINSGFWLLGDPGFEVITSPGGVAVDHDCDGTSDLTVGASSNFYPGLQAIPCDCSGQTPTYTISKVLCQSPDCGFLGFYPPQEEQITIFPVIQTECPAVQTECPIIPTWCPMNPTFCPKTPFTQCPLEPTLCPPIETHCPDEPTVCHVTECPTDPTICPTEQTICPTIWTECPSYPTWCPIEPTLCPQQDTECPTMPTMCDPAGFTVCFGQPTWCPIEPTVCPIEFTFCPEGPTLCPEINTICPDSQPTICKITQCPEDPTICTQDGNLSTECPTDFTFCPFNPTWCPEDITNCPMVWTTCPDIPTECPDDPTFCPLDPTNCPTGNTFCPVDPTNCPVNPTFCPATDSDNDGALDCNDNCLNHPNGPLAGTCTKGNYGAPCTAPGPNVAECGTGGFCSMAQEDTYPPGGNGCGDACECEGNFDNDQDQDGSDAAKFKADFGRSPFFRPCTNVDSCNGDFDCDGDVDGTDAALFKADFGRSPFFNPCPICPTDPWCTYP